MLSFTITACLIAACAAVASDAQAELLGNSSVARALQPFVDSHALAGAVALVCDKNNILSVDAVGWQDVAAKKPMKSDALFWIASQSKPITATALMMLVDEGKLRLDDPVEKYLPEFHGQWLATKQDETHVLLTKPTHSITVRNILSHTSGLPFASAMENPTLDTLPLRVAVQSYAMTPLQFAPNSKYSYSNAGINTAGRLIEVLSGMPYEEFLQKRLFDPLGMKDTTFWPTKAQQTRLAKSYKPNADKTDLEDMTVTQLHYPLDDRAHRYPMPAGGLFSTAHDVARFCQMILNGGIFDDKRYLSETSVTAMTTKQTPPTVPDGYGLGWATSGDDFGHGGAYATNMNIDKQRGLVTIWLVQHNGFPKDGGEAINAFRKTANIVFDAPKR